MQFIAVKNKYVANLRNNYKYLSYIKLKKI